MSCLCNADMEYLGCYTDGVGCRVMLIEWRDDAMTIEKCLDYCVKLSIWAKVYYRYAGLQVSNTSIIHHGKLKITCDGHGRHAYFSDLRKMRTKMVTSTI